MRDDNLASVGRTRNRAGYGIPFEVDCVGNFNRIGPCRNINAGIATAEATFFTVKTYKRQIYRKGKERIASDVWLRWNN